MPTKHTAPPDHQSAAEMHQAIVALAERRRILMNEGAEIYRTRKSGIPPEPVFDDHARAVRATVASILNGNTPPAMMLPPVVSRSEQMKIELEALALVERVYSLEYEAALDRQAEAWVATHADEWKTLARETTLTAVRLFALEERARTLLEQGLHGRWARGLVMAQHIGGGSSLLGIGDPVAELRNAALAENIITAAEVRKAENVQYG